MTWTADNRETTTFSDALDLLVEDSSSLPWFNIDDRADIQKLVDSVKLLEMDIIEGREESRVFIHGAIFMFCERFEDEDWNFYLCQKMSEVFVWRDRAGNVYEGWPRQ